MFIASKHDGWFFQFLVHNIITFYYLLLRMLPFLWCVSIFFFFYSIIFWLTFPPTTVKSLFLRNFLLIKASYPPTQRYIFMASQVSDLHMLIWCINRTLYLHLSSNSVLQTVYSSNASMPICWLILLWLLRR